VADVSRLVSLTLPADTRRSTVEALGRRCPHLRRVALPRRATVGAATLAALAAVAPAVDDVDLRGWDRIAGGRRLLAVLGGGGGGGGGGTHPGGRAPLRRLALPRGLSASAVLGRVRAPPGEVDVGAPWGPHATALSRLLAAWAVPPPPAALRVLTLRDVTAPVVGAVAAAPPALLRGLTRLALAGPSGGGVAGARRARARAFPTLEVGVASSLWRLSVLELTRLRLVGGGLPMLLWSFGAAAAAAAAAAGGSVADAAHPLTAVALTSVDGVYALDGAARMGDPDVFPVGYGHPLGGLAVVATRDCRPVARPGRVGATDAGRGPRRRLAAAYPRVAWVVTPRAAAPYPPPPPYSGW